jgi:hypothetical protein
MGNWRNPIPNGFIFFIYTFVTIASAQAAKPNIAEAATCCIQPAPVLCCEKAVKPTMAIDIFQIRLSVLLHIGRHLPILAERLMREPGSDFKLNIRLLSVPIFLYQRGLRN